MNYTPRPLPKHRRARLLAWTLAMLAWLAAVLVGAVRFTDRHERQRARAMPLTRLKRTVEVLIIARARDFTHARQCKRYPRAFRGRRLVLRALVRALIGSRVRRLLKRKGLIERIAALVHALKNIDAYARLLTRRLRRGLNRRWPAFSIAPIGPDDRLIPDQAPQTAFADSS
jgi:hypothetical protein